MTDIIIIRHILSVFCEIVDIIDYALDMSKMTADRVKLDAISWERVGYFWRIVHDIFDRYENLGLSVLVYSYLINIDKILDAMIPHLTCCFTCFKQYV